MLADINGVQHRLRFSHEMRFREVPAPTKSGTRKIQVPFTVKAQFVGGERDLAYVSKARAVTSCRVLTGKKPDVTVVASGLAVCSWSEKEFDKEFARQLALARVISQLPRDVAAPILGAYMTSAPRTLCDISAATRGKYKTLTDALPKKRMSMSADTDIDLAT